MPLRNEVEKLLQQARETTVTSRRKATSRRLMGLSLERLFEEAEKSLTPETFPLWMQIDADAVEISNSLPESVTGDDYLLNSHGIVNWLLGLGSGWWSLPERLPAAFLQFYIDDFKHEKETYEVWKHFNPDRRLCSPHIFNRCVNCYMATPYRGTGFSACPVCGGKLWERDLSNGEEMVFTDSKGLKVKAVDWF